jgi:hypothetical protein
VYCWIAYVVSVVSTIIEVCLAGREAGDENTVGEAWKGRQSSSVNIPRYQSNDHNQRGFWSVFGGARFPHAKVARTGQGDIRQG